MTDQDLPRGEGCIEGMRCPKCGNFERFKIVGTQLYRVSADGTDDAGGEIEWDNDSLAVCPDCSFQGTVGDFLTERALDPMSPEVFFRGRSHWDVHPRFPVADWQYQIAEGGTRQGYQDWCRSEWDALNDQKAPGMEAR